MAQPQFPKPVKLFIAVLWADCTAFDQACIEVQKRWGRSDWLGTHHPFDQSGYYEQEMGANLQRTLITFEKLFPAESIGEAKLATNEIEDALSVDGKRPVNLDVGYLDHNKIVLASMKYSGHKIYLGQGIYADFVGRFKAGRYQPFEWTFPDFRTGRYDEELLTIRTTYLQQLKQLRNCPNTIPG